MPTATVSGTPGAAGIRYGRILVAALLLEIVLAVVLIPIALAVDSPLREPPGGDYTIFFASVFVGCFVFAYGAGWWAARGLAAGGTLHGLLVGVVATAMYLGLAAFAPGGLAAVIDGYGPLAFSLANGLRIAGATIGGTMGRR